MALHDRVKTALDETRTLILGAQILLGFQCQGVFQERFDLLPPHARAMDGWALGLMLMTIALLIAPSAFHRIAEQGADTGRCHIWIGRFAAAALLPMAVGLGLDLALILERILGRTWAGGAIGCGVALLALGGWFGAGEMMKRRFGCAERRQAGVDSKAYEMAPLHARVEQMLTEARVILPGAQALLGFQLVIVLTSAFEKLPEISRLVHGASLLCIALTVILLITPAALHRIIWAGEDSEAFLRIGGRVTVAALVPLAFGMAGDVYVVYTRLSGSMAWGGIATAVLTVLLLGLWLIWPLALRNTHGPGHDS